MKSWRFYWSDGTQSDSKGRTAISAIKKLKEFNSTKQLHFVKLLDQ